jgi:DNA-directed RNA polymerase subunit F
VVFHERTVPLCREGSATPPAETARQFKKARRREVPVFKVSFDSKDAVPKHLLGKVTETDDGKFVVEVASADELHDISGLKSALEREREDRRQAKKEAEELAKRFGDLDPEKAREAMARIQEMDDKDLLEAGKVDELLQQRTEKMRADLEGQIEALKEKNTSLKAELDSKTSVLNEVVIDAEITKALDKNGFKVKKGALDDVLTRARRTWHLDENGKPVAMDGDKKLYGSDGTSPLGTDEWAKGLFEGASHLFDESSGGGAQSGDGDGPGGKKTVRADDPKAFAENLEDIATGKVDVAVD